jgi:hypothetical protein
MQERARVASVKSSALPARRLLIRNVVRQLFMKAIHIALILLTFTLIARADNISDVQKAFDTFVKYQKTDDPRGVDLFAKDVSVTFTFTDGQQQNTKTLPSDAFFENLKSEIAKKKGNNDTYKDIKITEKDGIISVDCSLVDGATKKSTPYHQEYVKTPEGLKISKIVLTVFVAKP